VRLVFDAAEGPAIVAGLADLGDRFRVAANEIDIVEPDNPVPHLPVARAVSRSTPDLGTAAEAWLTAAGPHHTVLSQAIGMEELSDFSVITGVELVAIDAQTTPRRFADELAGTTSTTASPAVCKTRRMLWRPIGLLSDRA
jgi:L-arabinose isomerase